MLMSNVVMALACVLFIASGILAYWETQTISVGTALICIGVANSLLLWEAVS